MEQKLQIGKNGQLVLLSCSLVNMYIKYSPSTNFVEQISNRRQFSVKYSSVPWRMSPICKLVNSVFLNGFISNQEKSHQCFIHVDVHRAALSSLDAAALPLHVALKAFLFFLCGRKFLELQMSLFSVCIHNPVFKQDLGNV